MTFYECFEILATGKAAAMGDSKEPHLTSDIIASFEYE